VVEETIEETVTECTEASVDITEPAETAPTEETSEPVIATTEAEDDSNVGMSEIEMLACVIYQEVGGDAACNNCRRRVADVVLNRVADERFPNTIYEVLTQPGQYGAFSQTGVRWADRADDYYEAAAVNRAWCIAEEVMNGQHSELYGEGYVWQAGFVQGTDGFWCCNVYYGR
jgi:spore germination cell wall hydrolase CwlJ-like protein